MTNNKRIKLLTGCVDAFISTTELLESEMEKNPSPIGIPLVVNAAFAAELSIKRHIEVTTGCSIRGHKLRKLWDKISVEEKEEMIPRICKTVSLEETLFDEYLNKCSSTFEDWRYLHEKDNVFTNFLFLIALAREVRRLA